MSIQTDERWWVLILFPPPHGDEHDSSSSKAGPVALLPPQTHKMGGTDGD